MKPNKEIIEEFEKLRTSLMNYIVPSLDDMANNEFDAFSMYLKQALENQKKEFMKVIPEKRTEGILGILGTTHKDGVRNEGFNDCIDTINNNLNK